MTLKTEEIEAALIDDVCSRVREKLRDDEAPQVEEFVRQYYRRVPPEDLVDRSELDVYAGRPGALELHPPAGAQRGQGARLQPAVRAARLAVGAHGR